MFATLGTLPYSNTLRARLRRRFSPPAPTCSRVTLPNFFSFYHIQSPVLPDETLPWAQIAEAAGTLRTRMLVPQTLTPAPETPLRLFSPQILPLRYLAGSALHTLQTLGLDPAAQTLCVVDPRGVLCDMVERFVPLVAAVRVVTDELGAYGETAARLRSRCGLSLLLAPDIKSASGSTILLLDDEADAPLSYTGLVFTNHPCPRPNAVTLTPGEAVLPPEFAALCPPGIDPLTFAAAAYELCAADELDGLWSPCVPQPVTPGAATPADPSPRDSQT